MLGQIFGFSGKVHNEVFVEKVTRTAYWVFEGPSLRQRIFKEADVEMKHFRMKTLRNIGKQLTGKSIKDKQEKK